MRRITGVIITLLLSAITAFCRQMPSGRHYWLKCIENIDSLHHTFEEETETFYADKESTDNLMNYNDGTFLTHTQWQWAHEKHRNVPGFLDDESVL